MKRTILIIFVAFTFIDTVASMPIRDSNQVLSSETVLKIIEHRVDIFELLYKSRVYNYAFEFLRAYHGKPADEWADTISIKEHYDKIIANEAPERLRDFFDDNNFAKDAFTQFVTCYYILEILSAELIYENNEEILNKIIMIRALFNIEDIMLINRFREAFLSYSSSELEKLRNIRNLPINDSGDLSINDSFMKLYIQMLDTFVSFDEDIDQVYSYFNVLEYVNSYSRDKYGYSPYDNEIQNRIQQAFNSEESEEVIELFNRYNVENGYNKFVVVGAIVQILTMEKIFLGELPELRQYMDNLNSHNWVDYDDIAPYLRNINDLLQSFDENTIQLVRDYLDSITEMFIEDIK